jgi:hypothetical protein
MNKGKSYYNQKYSLKQGLSGDEIEQLLSTSSNGRIYKWKRLHGKSIYSCRTHIVSEMLRKTLVISSRACYSLDKFLCFV